jgi:hypothetical protein
MFNKFYNKHVEEWYNIIKPFGLLDKIIQFMQILMPRVSNIADTIVSYKYRYLNKGYTFIKFSQENISYAAPGTLVAGGYDTKYPYVVKNINSSTEILGCGYTENMALRGIDYIIKDNVYLFREHPSKYCYTFISKDKVYYTTIGYVSDISAIPVIGHTTEVSKEVTANIIDTLTKSSAALPGNIFHLYQKGIYVTNGINGTVVKTWANTTYKFAIMSTGGLVAIHKSNPTQLITGSPIHLEDTKNYFTIYLDGIYYPVSMLYNKVENYPNLLQYYPTLNVSDKGFPGSDLYNILMNKGCSFTEIPYINNYSVDNTLLRNTIKQGDNLMYLGTVHASKYFNCSSAFKVAPESPDTSFKILDIKVKYIY